MEISLRGILGQMLGSVNTTELNDDLHDPLVSC